MKIVDINSIPRNSEPKKIYPNKVDLVSAVQHKKYRNYVIGILVATVSTVAFIWSFYQEKKNIEAQNNSFQAIYHFEANDFDKALNGDGTHKGFLSIIKAYPYTATAQLLHLYSGLAYMHQKEYEQAITSLKKFSCKDFIVQARAWSVIGDAYAQQNKCKEAAEYYVKAAHYKENSIYTPRYLMKAAIHFEAIQQYTKAYHCYQEVVEKYPDCSHSELALKEAARLSTYK